MQKQNSFIGFLLIALGIFFMVREIDLPVLEPFYTWPSMLIIVGITLIFHCYREKEFESLFTATIILGLGIHLHGIMHYSWWITHWAIYPLIVGLALIIRFLRTKKGIIPGVFFLSFAVLMLFSVQMPSWFKWVYLVLDYLDIFWPALLVVFGIYLLKKKPRAE